ncbi:SMC-Scp complex subunit ScpB [Actinomyces sp. W5033]|uniref:SMC-Scp complex subunit ScpB n=1 Tax=Actinomyces sp. W5033 TaxID=3446479 RepID=UPI003EE41C04
MPDAQLRAAAEAVLIVADEPVTTAALAEALGTDEHETEALLESLAAEYEGRGGDPAVAPRGFVLRRAAGGWRLASAPLFHDLVERFVVGGATSRLSQAALETLAVIAYRQPVSRGRVAAVRGVNVDGVVRTLHARGLIEEAGQEPSGAHLYRTTREFLEFLGLNSLDELPPLAPYLPDASALAEIDDEAGQRAADPTHRRSPA